MLFTTLVPDAFGAINPAQWARIRSGLISPKSNLDNCSKIYQPPWRTTIVCCNQVISTVRGGAGVVTILPRERARQRLNRRGSVRFSCTFLSTDASSVVHSLLQARVLYITSQFDDYHNRFWLSPIHWSIPRLLTIPQKISMRFSQGWSTSGIGFGFLSARYVKKVSLSTPSVWRACRL